MADYSLTAQTPLDGIRLEYGNVSISEVSGLAVVSLASPLGGENALTTALQTAYQISLPATGHSSASPDDKTHLLGMQRDQFFLLFDYPGPFVTAAVEEKIGAAAYICDQSDSWAILRLAGADSRKALERICSIDLDPDSFGAGAVTRTVMEHIGVIIYCEAPDSYLLMSLRSYAKSFLHALEVSAKNI
ncbi:MAG: sarcosine oxidase subunit gamma [Gammaproteobacteria bacterium]|nr:sarcosine oxidase subunit gamma [Gammaproteobacteria bacterium]